MRIRKKPRKASIDEGEQPVVGLVAPQLLKASAIENVLLEEEMRTISRTTPVMEPASPGLKSKLGLPGEQGKPPGISMLPTPQGQMKLASSAHGGSDLSGDPGWHADDGQKDASLQHTQRNQKKCAPTPVHIGEQPVVAARISILEVEGNGGAYEQGEESKALTTVIFPSPLEELKSSLDPMMTESDTEAQQIHPSKASEGSLLHSLYLQLLAAGSEGMILADLFTSFKMQSAWPRFASDWKHQVRFHLKNNPHFNDVHGCYLLYDNQLDVQQQPKHSSAVTLDTVGHVGSSRQSNRQLNLDDHLAPTVKPACSKGNHEGVQTRRRTYQKKLEAALTQSATDYETLQLSHADMHMAALVSDPSVSQPAIPMLSRKRKSSPNDIEQLDDRPNPIRGALKAMQSRILSETGVQTGVPCARREVSKNWRCPMMAMPGYTLCKHHRSLRWKVLRHQQRGKTRKIAYKEPVSKTGISKTPNQSFTEAGGVDAAGLGAATIPLEEAETGKTTKHFLASRDAPGSSTRIGQAHSSPLLDRGNQLTRAIPGTLIALHAKIVAEKGTRSGVRCARTDRSSTNGRAWQCPLDAKVGRSLCEHHLVLTDIKNARYAAKIAAARRELNRNKRKPTVIHKQRNQVPVLQNPRPSTSVPVSPRGTVSRDGKHEELNVNNSPQGESSGDDDHADSDAEPLMQMNAPKRQHRGQHVAAKKTASNVMSAAMKTALDVSAVKANSQVHENRRVFRPPTIPPLPPRNTIRNKAAKNNKSVL